MTYPVVLFSGPAHTVGQARYLLEQEGFTLGFRNDSHGLPDTTEGTEDTNVAWLECVDVDEPDTDGLPWAELLYGDRSDTPGGLEALGWQLRMHEISGSDVQSGPDLLGQLHDRLTVIEELLTGAKGNPDPGAIQASAQLPPYAIQASAHSAELFRRATFALSVPGRGGVRQPTDLATAQNGTPNMSVNVAAGEVLIPGSSTSAQGIYYGYNDATVNLAIAASNPTNPRIDLVCATVDDAQYSGGANDWKLQVITGTPAGSPTVPALPASSLSLANVAVAALATTILNANITVPPLRAAGLGDVIVCTSTTRPASPWPGMTIFETDTFKLMQYQTATTLWTPPWNVAWGEVAFVSWTADQSKAAGAPSDITSATVTWTAIANRKYKYTIEGHTYSAGAANDVTSVYLTDGAGTAKNRWDQVSENTTLASVFAAIWRETGIAAGSVTRKLQIALQAGTGPAHFFADAARIASLLVEDAGPSANPA